LNLLVIIKYSEYQKLASKEQFFTSSVRVRTSLSATARNLIPIQQHSEIGDELALDDFFLAKF